MSSTVVDPPAAPAAPAVAAGQAVAGLRAATDQLAGLDWDALPEESVLELLRGVEIVKRRLAPVDHAALNQLGQRSTAFTHGARSTAGFVSGLLRVSRAEAHARVKAAEALGYRRTVTGLRVDPQFPLVAAAQAAGLISDRHAVVIVRTVAKLPDDIADRHGEFVERSLVGQAAEMDPAVRACQVFCVSGQDHLVRGRRGAGRGRPGRER